MTVDDLGSPPSSPSEPSPHPEEVISSPPPEQAERRIRPKAFQAQSLWPVAILAMGVILGGVIWRGYQSLSQQPAETVTAETAEPQNRLPVRVVEAKVGLAQKWIFDDGMVWPIQQQILNFEAEGHIEFVMTVNGQVLKAGDFVTQGQLLATIDSRKQRSAIATAEADLEVSIQQRNQADAQRIQAQASVEQAKSDLGLSQAELRRFQGLYDDGVVSESDRDVYANQVVQSEVALKRAEQDVQAAEDGIRSANASVEASRSRLFEAEIALEDTQLVAPVDGVIASINIREGEDWRSQRYDSSSIQSTLETAPIVIVNPQSVEVELELPASEAREIRPGQQAHVVLEEEISNAQAVGDSTGLLPLAQRRGTLANVFAVSPIQTVDRGTQVVLRNFRAVRNLRIGGRVYVWIEVAANPNALMVPFGALLPRDQEVFIFVVDEVNGVVERRSVQPGIESLNGVEIVQGLEPGELVVSEGINLLVDGAPVEVVAREED
ncbi:MAG: biotin/lipoyl-binding protein [Cyanothece sp. SIO2G6]|nr:biotin/lipoyl-binding protein [Cyanothece sp. SIO2G6]